MNYAPMPHPEYAAKERAHYEEVSARLGANVLASGPSTAVPREAGALTGMMERVGFLLTRMEQELHRGHVAMDRLLPGEVGPGGAPTPALSGAPLLAVLNATIERLESSVHTTALLAERVERAV